MIGSQHSRGAAIGWRSHVGRRANGPVLEACWQMAVEGCHHIACGVCEFGLGQEKSAETVLVLVGRHLRIETQHFRAKADPACGMPQCRQMSSQHRGDHYLIEPS